MAEGTTFASGRHFECVADELSKEVWKSNFRQYAKSKSRVKMSSQQE